MSDGRPLDRTLTYEADAPVLGVRVRLLTNSPDVAAAFEDAFARWRVAELDPQSIASRGIEVRIALEPGDEGGGARAAGVHQADGRVLRLTASGGSLRSDAETGEVTGLVTSALARDREHFRHHLLEAAVFWAITHGPFDRQPIHAAAVTRGGSALLLTGPGGTGKSTLTYAAARAGIEVLADDLVWGQSRPLRVWGMPGVVSVPAASVRFFPELSGRPTRLMSNGKEKIVVPLSELGAAARVPFVERAGICIVERVAGSRPGWVRLTPAEVERTMRDQLEGGFELFRDTVGELIHALAVGGGWRLTLGDPDASARILRDLLDEIAPG